MIPGAIDYSSLGDHKKLEELLEWQLIHPIFESVENAKGIARGAPIPALQALVEGAASKAESAAYLPFPEGFGLGYQSYDLQNVQAFQTAMQWEIIKSQIAAQVEEFKRDLAAMVANNED